VSERFRVTYVLTSDVRADAEAKAMDLALEQTVELPASCLSPEVAREVVGLVETVEAEGASRWRAVVSYSAETVGDELLQYVNLLFGNISLKEGILITDAEVPAAVRDRCKGPRFGIAGIRALCENSADRPLLCAAAKPVGLSSSALAETCYDFAAGGIDIVKDDHGLANQASAPFSERVPRCQDAVERANARYGSTTLYFPHVSAAGSALDARLEIARSVGCRGVLVSPLLLGLDVVRELAEESGLALLAHPALAGAFFQPAHGIAVDVLLGRLFRLIGSDGVVYPNVGGRFPFSAWDCHAINSRLREPWVGVRAAFPIPAGGIDVARVPHWIEQYGVDTMFLIGASLYEQRDIQRATERLVEAVRASCTTPPPS
jgi:ribulose-bisphosphate carboxylase large chain